MNGVAFSTALAGLVHEESVVVRYDRPSAFLLMLAVHTSLGDRKTWKSNTSSELAAPRKRTFTALPCTASVLTMLNSVLLPSCVVK